MNKTFNCIVCGNETESNHPTHKICSEECRNMRYKAKIEARIAALEKLESCTTLKESNNKRFESK